MRENGYSWTTDTGVPTPDRKTARPARALFIACLLLMVGLLPGPHCEAAAAEDHDTWRKKLSSDIAELLKGEIDHYSVSLHDPVSGFRMDINADRVYPSASTMKTGITLALFRLARKRRLSLNRRIWVRNRFKSVVDGSRYKVPVEQSEHCACRVWKKRRKRASLRLINRDMIMSSSNLATNILINYLGPKKINRELRAMGIQGLSISRGLYDMKAFDKNWHNTMTARGARKLFEAMINPRYFSWSLRREMLRVHAYTEHRDKIPALLPPDVYTPQKSGYTDDVSHDAGLVYPEPGRPYALAILTEKHKDRNRIEEKMGLISKMIFEAILQIRAARK